MQILKSKIGANLQVTLADQGDKIDQIIYSSKILEVEDDNVITIMAPTFKFNSLVKDVGIKLDLKIDDTAAGYFGRFDAVICSREKVDNISYYKVKIIGGEEYGQRRKFFRVPCRLNIYEYLDGSVLNSYINNISACGAKMVSDVDIEIGSKIEFETDINDIDIYLEGVVVRTEQIQQNNSIRFDIAIEFNNISNYDKEFIVKYVLKEQAKQIYLGQAV